MKESKSGRGQKKSRSGISPETEEKRMRARPEQTAEPALSIDARIAAARLTPRDRKALDYIIKNRKTACFETAAQIAGQAGVSPSSVARSSLRLGFDSFGAFKRQLQAELQRELEGGAAGRRPIPYEKIGNCEGLTDAELIRAVRENARRNIEADQNPGDYEKYARAADILSGADRVFIVGFRACAGFAYSLSVMLSCVRPGVYAVNGAFPTVDSLVDLTKRDAVVPISYERYSSDTVFAAAMARKAGSRIIAVTDSVASPLCQGAEVILLNSTENLSFYNSYVSLAMSMEVLAALVSRRNRAQNEERLKKMEEFLTETGQY